MALDVVVAQPKFGACHGECRMQIYQLLASESFWKRAIPLAKKPPKRKRSPKVDD
jgi:hypothetical protein